MTNYHDEEEQERLKRFFANFKPDPKDPTRRVLKIGGDPELTLEETRKAKEDFYRRLPNGG